MSTPVTPEREQFEADLARQYMPLVDYEVTAIATRVPRYVCRNDLVSAGMEGLAQAARSYDPERGVRFPRFASVRIRGAILDELRARDWASRSVRARARQVAAVVETLTSELGRAPERDEIAEAAGKTHESLAALDHDVWRGTTVHLDSLGFGGSSADEALIADERPIPEDILMDREQQSYLVAAVENLPERLRRAVVGHFVEGRPMIDIAEELGVTDSRVSQMCAEGCRLLREAINAQLDPDLNPDEESPRVARRLHAYFAAVAEHESYRRRLDPDSAQLARFAQTA